MVYDLLKKAKMITEFDYDDTKYGLKCALEDVINEYYELKSNFEEYKQDVKENYELKKHNPYIEYGINEEEFH